MATTTSSKVLEITLISGEELFITRKQRVKRNAYVIVKTDKSNFHTTNEDKDGGSNPSWNQKIIMHLPNNARYLTAEVHCKTITGNKVVGMVNIPTSDFLGGYAPQGSLQFLSYRLRDLNGERNGIVNLSVRVKMDGNSGTAGSYHTNWSRPWTSGIVTGFPVGYK